ncbi:hypothetical protein PR048_032618 [Dryococelus australis]|uniref:Uncharacterized protein n=1 Tax=Dryococelus australis TaxID=614101 RepID=A0ABQ9G5P1_9NEOP|nr:hypothetical protein PR048_032618 [Dryococelus australis]
MSLSDRRLARRDTRGERSGQREENLRLRASEQRRVRLQARLLDWVLISPNIEVVLLLLELPSSDRDFVDYSTKGFLFRKPRDGGIGFAVRKLQSAYNRLKDLHGKAFLNQNVAVAWIGAITTQFRKSVVHANAMLNSPHVQGTGETGDPRENPQTGGIVRNDPRLLKATEKKPSCCFGWGVETKTQCPAKECEDWKNGRTPRKHTIQLQRLLPFQSVKIEYDVGGNRTRIVLAKEPGALGKRPPLLVTMSQRYKKYCNEIFNGLTLLSVKCDDVNFQTTLNSTLHFEDIAARQHCENARWTVTVRFGLWCDVSARGCFDSPVPLRCGADFGKELWPEHRVVLVRTYSKTDSVKAYQPRFTGKAWRQTFTVKSTIWVLAKKLETKGTSLDTNDGVVQICRGCNVPTIGFTKEVAGATFSGNLIVKKHLSFVTYLRRPANSRSLGAARTGLDSRRGGFRIFACGESCRTMLLVGGFSRGSLVSPALSFGRCFILSSLHPICAAGDCVEAQRSISCWYRRRRRLAGEEGLRVREWGGGAGSVGPSARWGRINAAHACRQAMSQGGRASPHDVTMRAKIKLITLDNSRVRAKTSHGEPPLLCSGLQGGRGVRKTGCNQVRLSASRAGLKEITGPRQSQSGDHKARIYPTQATPPPTCSPRWSTCSSIRKPAFPAFRHHLGLPPITVYFHRPECLFTHASSPREVARDAKHSALNHSPQRPTRSIYTWGRCRLECSGQSELF